MINFLESHLGELKYGWKSESSDIKVVLFKNQPQMHVSSYVTVGLSDSVLTLKKDKVIRQELIFSVKEEQESDSIPMSLISFADHIKDTGKGLLRGDCIGPGKPFIINSNMVGVYSSIPVFFEESFQINEGFTPPVIIIWLIPLLVNEIEFIRSNGWLAFEKLLENSSGLDFWNINRASFLF
jgi:hypothetical protein